MRTLLRDGGIAVSLLRRRGFANPWAEEPCFLSKRCIALASAASRALTTAPARPASAREGRTQTSSFISFRRGPSALRASCMRHATVNSATPSASPASACVIPSPATSTIVSRSGPSSRCKFARQPPPAVEVTAVLRRGQIDQHREAVAQALQGQAAAAMVVAGVHHDAVKPGGEPRLAPEARDLLDQGAADLLGHVLGVGGRIP